MSTLPIVTISRQSGSQGREAGRLLADQLGVPYYDYEILSRAARESGLSPALFEQAETSAAELLDRLEQGLPAQNTPINVAVFEAQSKIIRKMAKEAPCVIVGRCADTVLREFPNVVNVYIYASEEKRIENTARKKRVNPKMAALFIRQIDRSRSAYHSFFSHHAWGDMNAYVLCVCTDKLTPEETANVIKSYLFAKSGE
ncbi:MAG: cytidylate kinase-like family protein [Oscillospiraceae bacterium]|nr:cytidylate kinase-like family protein [Oscillospiraceae bacterium]